MGKHIGLIGGIGPAATVIYYQALVRLCAAAGHKLELTIAHADIRALVANLEAGHVEAQVIEYIRHIDQLQAAGCAAVAVTSMGGHFCIAELEAVSPLLVLNAVSALRHHFAQAGIAHVGVLGTRAVMESRIYGLSGVKVIPPEPDEIARVHADYVAVAVSSVATADQRRRLVAAGKKLHERGAEVVVLGGTDLSVVFDNAEPGYPVVDSAVIHAEAIARAAMDD